MDIFIIVLIIFAVLVIIGFPLVNAKRYRVIGNGTLGVDQFEDVYSERDRVLDALRDLQIEHATGKISDADYAMLKGRYDTKAAVVLQEIDALEMNTSKKSATRQAKAQGACPRCHARLEPDDRFCFECGYKL